MDSQTEQELFVNGRMLSSCMKTEDLSEPEVLSVKHPYSVLGLCISKLNSSATECKHQTRLKHAVCTFVH